MIRFVTAFAAALIWTALAAAPAAAADKVVLMLNWYVYGEHAPFYYGKAKGIFAAENIDLEIQEGRGSAATTQAVAAKTADFGYVDVPTMMRAAIKGAPVVATGVLLQTSPMSAMGFVTEPTASAICPPIPFGACCCWGAAPASSPKPPPPPRSPMLKSKPLDT